MVVENGGREPIIDVIVSRSMATVTNGRICGACMSTIPPAPGEKRPCFWTIPRLNAGEIQRKPLTPVLEEGLKLANEVRSMASIGGLNGRRFEKLIRVMPSQPANTGAIIANTEGDMFWQNFREAIEQVRPEW